MHMKRTRNHLKLSAIHYLNFHSRLHTAGHLKSQGNFATNIYHSHPPVKSRFRYPSTPPPINASKRVDTRFVILPDILSQKGGFRINLFWKHIHECHDPLSKGARVSRNMGGRECKGKVINGRINYQLWTLFKRGLLNSLLTNSKTVDYFKFKGESSPMSLMEKRWSLQRNSSRSISVWRTEEWEIYNTETFFTCML